MTIDEIEVAIRLLSPADHAELTSRIKQRDTPEERILKGVNKLHLIIEISFLKRIIKMRKEKELRIRPWSSQKTRIRTRLKAELDKEKLELYKRIIERRNQLDNNFNTIWQGQEDLLQSIRFITKGSPKKPSDEDPFEDVLEVALKFIGLQLERIEIVFQFLDETLNTDKRISGKHRSWVNSYISWRTHQPVSTIKTYFTSLRKGKKQSQP